MGQGVSLFLVSFLLVVFLQKKITRDLQPGEEKSWWMRPSGFSFLTFKLLSLLFSNLCLAARSVQSPEHLLCTEHGHHPQNRSTLSCRGTGPALPGVGQEGMGIKGTCAGGEPGRNESLPLKSIFRTPRIPNVLVSLATKHPFPPKRTKQGLAPHAFPRAMREVEG